MNTNEILEERQKTHGEFKDFAQISQAIGRACNARPAQISKLTPVQLEAMHMIVVKIARILNGNPNLKDHWDDIAGYAALAARELQ